jgi:hypothetical protein
MIGREELAGMSEDDVLAAAGMRAERIRDDEADLLRLAYQMAVINSAQRLDPSSSDKPGREKARQYGGDGTPQVAEFAAAAFGARIGITTFAAGQLMADAMDLVHRSTDLWARVEAGEVKASYARFVVKQTRHLPAEEAQYVATAVAEPADGRIPWTRFEALVEASIAKANPEVAREKEERARKATFAKKLRAEAHGMASFLVRGPVSVIEQIAATVEAYSEAIAEDFPDLTDDERIVQAVLMLLTPGADQEPGRLGDRAPVVNLYVHTYSGADSTGIARLEGHGPVTEDWVRDVLGPTCRFKIQPVLDLEGLAPVDAYEIPDRHRQAVHLMTPADVFPFSSSLSRKQQVDHTIPFDAGGVSGLGNYGPMTVPHHRIKTHAGWDVRQPFPGIYLWRDPHGAHYLVDHTGTRSIPEAADDLPLVVEIYRNLPEATLDWDAA